MWQRLLDMLCCPICKEPLDLCAFIESSVQLSAEHLDVAAQSGVSDSRLNHHVEAGLLLCHRCKHWFPIVDGLPILVPYETPAHRDFATRFKDSMSQMKVTFEFPSQKPVTGEQFVMETFSKEWRSYDYDGVIWSMTYDDLEKRFLNEVGFQSDDASNVERFLEIGCGLGITTYFAHKHYRADAVGVDLSLAAFLAARQYASNPFMHFMQASAFYLPLKRDIFDAVYSHGVLHHTYSTEKAFQAVAPHCGPGGLLYVWVYGTRSQTEGVIRHLAYALEAMIRPTIARNSSSLLARSFLAVIALAYVLVNTLQRLRNPNLQRYTYKRALHAARDRFTPLFAHRQDSPEVSRWFAEAGFEKIQIVDWRTMPRADQDNYRRNTGIRGWRRTS